MNTRNALKIVTGLAMVVGAVPQAHAVTGCTNALLAGAYGWQFSGSLTRNLSGGVGGAVTPPMVIALVAAENAADPTDPSANVPLPAAGIARLFVDGAGGLYGNSSVNVDGAWSEGPMTGSYTVNDDCTATFTLTDSGAGTQHFDAILGSQGDIANLMQTDPGTAVSGTLRRARGFCQPSDLIGSFSVRTAGSLQGSGPFTSVGRITIDDQGNITGSESRFSSGAYSQVTSSGALSVNPDCTLSLTLSAASDGAMTNFRGMVVNNVKEMVLVRADDGASVIGNVIAQ